MARPCDQASTGGDCDDPPSSLTEPLLAPSPGQIPSLDAATDGDGDGTISSARRPGEADDDDAHDDDGHDDRDGRSRPPPTISRNIGVVLTYTLLAFAGRSLWSQSALSAFVYLLRDGDPERVGYLTAIMGASQLLASFPSGYFADVGRRDRVLRFASALGLCAICTTAYAALEESYEALGVALGIWGSYWGVANTSVAALFADSIRDGDRSMYLTKRMVRVKCGNLAGPVLAMAMFGIGGNEWTPRDCAFVMAAGQALCLPGVLLLWALNDDDAVPHDDDKGLARPLLDGDGLTENDATEESATATAGGEERDGKWLFCISEKRRVPVLIACADLTSGIASGMSIRYFPIFFLDNLKLSPVVVQAVYAIALLLQIITSKLAMKGGERYGRPQAAAALKWAGLASFVSLIVTYVRGFPRWVVCGLFALRMTFTNSTGALTKSVLMDHVPKSERGKWSALESVNMFSWAGSAAFGGLLVKVEGLVFNFVCTAALQTVATVPLVMLWGLVKNERDMREGRGGGGMQVERQAPENAGAMQRGEGGIV